MCVFSVDLLAVENSTVTLPVRPQHYPSFAGCPDLAFFGADTRPALERQLDYYVQAWCPFLTLTPIGPQLTTSYFLAYSPAVFRTDVMPARTIENVNWILAALGAHLGQPAQFLTKQQPARKPART